MSLLLICQSSTPHTSQVRQFLAAQPDFSEFFVNAAHPDLHILAPDDDAENFSPLQIEDVRTVIQDMALKPYQADQSLYIICKIDAASQPAQHALLKSLEEPPAHVQIVLTTDQPERILATIKSRCVIKKIGERENTTSPAPETVAVWQKVTSGRISDIFEVSEIYKDRITATKLIDDMIRLLHQQNQQQSSAKNTAYLQKLLTAKELLRKNVNVRLVLEDSFLNFTKI